MCLQSYHNILYRNCSRCFFPSFDLFIRTCDCVINVIESWFQLPNFPHSIPKLFLRFFVAPPWMVNAGNINSQRTNMVSSNSSRCLFSSFNLFILETWTAHSSSPYPHRARCRRNPYQGRTFPSILSLARWYVRSEGNSRRVETCCHLCRWRWARSGQCHRSDTRKASMVSSCWRISEREVLNILPPTSNVTVGVLVWSSAMVSVNGSEREVCGCGMFRIEGKNEAHLVHAQWNHILKKQTIVSCPHLNAKSRYLFRAVLFIFRVSRPHNIRILI